MFGLFESEKSQKRKSHLRNLVALAKLDGVVSREEYNFLLKIGERAGVKASAVKDMISRTATVKVTKPDNNLDRFEIIYDLIAMSLADGHMDEDEIDYCVDFAARLGFRPAISGVLVRKVATDMLNGLDKPAIIDNIATFLTFKKK
jgi:uncharacterized tellurite resistance protein B-like protein